MRGKLAGLMSPAAVVRITPACAGKTYYMGLWAGEIRDHPRVCGENMRIEWECLILEGSPPRVRGKRFFQTSHKPAMGITPACAGKTLKIKMLLTKARDHPRVCGENQPSPVWATARGGSPPRVRGKHSRKPSAPVLYGITPACAGKTTLISRTG